MDLDGFSIHPKTNCPHVDAQVASVDTSTPLHGSPCVECGNCDENWLCMKCLKIHCSRFVHGHAARHVVESSHCIALSFADHSTWCYECDAYITSPVLAGWYDHVYKTKFNEPPGFNIHTIALEIQEREQGGSSSSSASSSSSSSSSSAPAPPTPRPAAPKSSLPNDQVINRIRGVIFGQCIGDAFGLATEFLSPETALKFYGKSGPKDYSEIVQDSHRDRWKKGDWTDDTDQMIVIMRSIVKNKGVVNVLDIAKGLYEWMCHGIADFGDIGGFGLGRTVGTVLRSPAFLDNPHAVAKQVFEASSGFAAANGGVMRTSILGILNFDDLEKVIENTVNVCLITHADPRCVASCVATTTAIALILQGKYNPSSASDMTELAKQSLQYGLRFLTGPENGAFREEFERYAFAPSVSALGLNDGGIGYTFKAFGCGFLGLRSGEDFESLLRKIIMAGGDADTNGAVFGAAAGARVGYDRLPQTLRDQLIYKDWMTTEVDELLKTMGYAL